PVNWKNPSHLTIDLYKELAVSQYLTGEFEKAEVNFNQLLTHAKDKISKLQFYTLYCEMLAMLNKHTEAIQQGLTVLGLMGIHLPENPNMLHILRAIFKIKWRLGWQKPQ